MFALRFAFYSLLAGALAAAPPVTAPHKPKLVLAIAIDQFRYDYLTRYRSEYTGGLNRLLTKGAVFTDANYDQAPTVTAIGHSLFLSGAFPSVSGIAGNEWFDRTLGKTVTSVSDDSVQLLGGSSEGGASPRRLLVSTVGDELKIASGGKSHVIGISLKDRSAILPAGHMADGAFWIEAKTGNIVSSTYYFPELPAWVKDVRKFTLLFNARAETVMEKPAFKNAMKRRRCLIPADGYYEWQAYEKRKRPHFIHRRDGGPIGVAGLAETWIGPNGEELDTVAIVTAPASADLAVLHHRVPATIAPDDFERWLDCGAHDAETAMALLKAPEEGEFVWHEVSTRVNRVANDDAQLILPITAEEMATEQASPPKRPAPRKPQPVPSEDDGQGSLF